MNMERMMRKLKLRLPECTAVAFTGGGGKTSLIFRLAEELTETGKRTIIVTTTHMAYTADRPFAENGDRKTVRKNLFRCGYTVAASLEKDSGKLCGLPEDQMKDLRDECDVMLIEADGYRRLAVKVPEGWEPVIPDFADTVVGVIGLDALGKPICRTAHRAELTASFLKKKPEDTVTPEDFVKIASSENGLRKNVGERLYRVYLNKADTLPSHEIPEEICRKLKKKGIQAAYGSLWPKKTENKR